MVSLGKWEMSNKECLFLGFFPGTGPKGVRDTASPLKGGRSHELDKEKRLSFQSIRAELIVMTSHGRRGMKEHYIGSVAERVLRLAKCPVLTLKPHAE